jgi:hypothetical protein
MKHKLLATWFGYFTGEYVGGVMAGTGFGIIIANALMATSTQHIVIPPLVWICAFGCSGFGSLMARSAYQKRHTKKDVGEKHDAS